MALTIKANWKIYLNSLIFRDNTIGEVIIGNTKLVLLTGSLLNEQTDAIVNAANRSLKPGGGVCGAIYDKVGNEPFDECKEILKKQNRESLNEGEAVLTSSGKKEQPFKAIIHTPGPQYDVAKLLKNLSSMQKDEIDKIKKYKNTVASQLADCYLNSLTILTNPSKQPNYWKSKMDNTSPMRSISFPSISTGIFGYPLEEAAPIAIKAIKTFIENNKDALSEVHFVFLPLEKDDQKTATYYCEELAKLT